VLGHYYEGGKAEVAQAIDAALEARSAWASMPWEDRAAIFLKAADLSATKYRMQLNARTMLGQSKNAYQAEIDAACEWIDFLRFNVHYELEVNRLNNEILLKDEKIEQLKALAISLSHRNANIQYTRSEK
jgi:1-pyrroline-5-carboxylate dehydrogenase